MVFRSKVSRPPKEAAKAAPAPAPERERTAEIPPRKVQHSFINADTKVTGDLKSGGDISVEGSVEGNIPCRTLTLTKTARMTGDINYEILELHEGAEFEGGIRRTGASSSRPVTSDGMAPNEPQQPVHASPG